MNAVGEPAIRGGDARTKREGHGLFLVFDIGGTTLRGGVFDAASGGLVARTAIPSAEFGVARGSPAQLVGRLVQRLDALARALAGDRLEEVDGAVVGFPGPMTDDGTVLAAPTLWPRRTVDPFPLRDLLAAVWRERTVTVINDVTAAAHAYAAPGRSTFCVLSVSSGIGHKVFVDGRPLTGPFGRGGEVGHVVVDRSEDAAECECGERGHLGALASGRGMREAARRRAREEPAPFAASKLGRRSGGDPDAVSAELLAACFRDRDPWSTGIVRAGAAHLGWVLALIHGVVGIEDFVIIGGFANALGPGFCAELGRAAARSCWSLGADWSRMVELGRLGDDAGLIGAGKLAAATFTRLW
jgi:predicted NBD/HSP70 family sugar kinase